MKREKSYLIIILYKNYNDLIFNEKDFFQIPSNSMILYTDYINTLPRHVNISGTFGVTRGLWEPGKYYISNENVIIIYINGYSKIYRKGNDIC